MKNSILKSIFCVLCVIALLTGCAVERPAEDSEPVQNGELNPENDSPVPEKEAEAPDTEQDLGFEYSENSDGTLSLTGYHGSGGELFIPAELGGKSIVSLGDCSFAGLLSLTAVHIPEGVEHIGSYAFECCGNLKKVYMPNSLKSIGDGAFSGCASLYLADFQDGVESIGRGAFLCCDSLVQLELPGALTELGEFAFAGCDVLSSVRFSGDGLVSLPDRVFYGCSSLRRLSLPESVTYIGKRAFSGCDSLEHLYFSNDLSHLGEYAFEGCSKLANADLKAEIIPTGLFSGCFELKWFSVSDGAIRIERGAFGSSGITNLSIPASVEEIEPGAFFQMRGSISLDGDNERYRLIDGSLYTSDGKTLVAYFPADPYSEDIQTEFTVPDGVETICAYAFAESGLTSISLPATLREIGAYAFEGVYTEDLTIPDGVAVDPLAFGDAEQGGEEQSPDEPVEEAVPEVIGSVAGDRNLFREEDYSGFREIGNDEFDNWCESYLAYNLEQGIELSQKVIPYIMRYKGEVVPHFIPMTAVQNRDPSMWAEAANTFGDDFEDMYLMMVHGLSTELSRGRIQEDLILYSGLYDSQLMAAAGTDVLPTQKQLVDAIGSEFSDPIMISTTTDPGVAAGFGDTLFIIYASRETMETLGAICIDAVAHSSEKEILMNPNAHYRILDVGNMAIEQQNDWDTESSILFRGYVKVELVTP